MSSKLCEFIYVKMVWRNWFTLQFHVFYSHNAPVTFNTIGTGRLPTGEGPLAAAYKVVPYTSGTFKHVHQNSFPLNWFCGIKYWTILAEKVICMKWRRMLAADKVFPRCRRCVYNQWGSSWRSSWCKLDFCLHHHLGHHHHVYERRAISWCTNPLIRWQHAAF